MKTLLFLAFLFLVLVTISQMFYTKEGFTRNINKYTRPKMREIRLNTETFISSANGQINRVIRKIGI
jgi:hypothetical protein